MIRRPLTFRRVAARAGLPHSEEKNMKIRNALVSLVLIVAGILTAAPAIAQTSEPTRTLTVLIPRTRSLDVLIPRTPTARPPLTVLFPRTSYSRSLTVLIPR
jgi:hypothetical protein